MNRAKIFIVDDERTTRLTFRLTLKTDAYEVQEAASADEAMVSLKSEKYDLVILDLRLGEGSGLDVLAAMRERGIQTPTLMITAYGSIRNAVRAMKLGAIDFLEKPVEPAALRQLVIKIVKRYQVLPSGPVELGSLEDFLREAKRLINLQGFELAERTVTEALKIDDRSPDAHNLQGVLREIAGDYDAARKSYGRAIKLRADPPAAQQNMRRLYELFNCSASQEFASIILTTSAGLTMAPARLRSPRTWM